MSKTRKPQSSTWHRRKKAEAQGKQKHSAGFEDRRSVPMPQLPKNATQFVRDQYDALLITAGETRKRLDILRQTRGQRNVGALKIPVHLGGPGAVLSDIAESPDAEGKHNRPEKRGDVAGFVLPTED